MDYLATLMSGFGYTQAHLKIASMLKELDPSGKGSFELADFKRVIHHYPRSNGFDWWLTVSGPVIGFAIHSKKLAKDIED